MLYFEFIKLHCGTFRKPLPMLNNASLYVCPDGAVIVAANAEQRYEPPTDPSERSRLILAYKQAALHAAEEELNAVQGNLVMQQNMASRYSNLPSIDPQAVVHVKRLKTKVRLLRAAVETMTAAHNETPAAVEQRARQCLAARLMNERERLLSDLLTI